MTTQFLAMLATVNAAKVDEAMDPHSPSRNQWNESANLHATAQELWLVEANGNLPQFGPQIDTDILEAALVAAEENYELPKAFGYEER